MSTTTVSFRSTTEDAEIDALRRREAEAREASRRAALRAEEERRREEAIRRRIAAAQQRIAEQEARYQREVTRLDEAARRLPDLSLSAPGLSSMSRETARDPVKLDAYAESLRSDVDRFSQVLNAAIAEAERLLQRRMAKAASWRNAADLEQQIALLVQRSKDEAARMHLEFTTPSLPAKPSAEAELETVQAYEAMLAQSAREAKRQFEDLRARVIAHEKAVALSGRQIQARNADAVLSSHEADRENHARESLRKQCDDELARTGLRFGELPAGVRAQIEMALELAPLHDFHPSVTRWIAREKQRRDSIARALELMQSVPDLIHADPQLSRRWSSLAGQLQRIAGGLEDHTPHVEREYEQIRADAHLVLNTAFTRADWIQAMSQEGFEVLERADGNGLVVIDLEHPEIWLEATEYEAAEGGFAASLELKTDAVSTSAAEETALTDDICAKLARAAGSASPSVATQSEVVEHKSHITRGRRPTAAKKAFAQQI